MPTVTPRAFSLVALCVHYSVLSTVMHYSRTQIPPDKSYKASSAVVLTEIGKLTLSFVMSLRDIHRKRKERYVPLAQVQSEEHDTASVLFDDQVEGLKNVSRRERSSGVGHVRKRSSITVAMEDPSTSTSTFRGDSHGKSTSISASIPLSTRISEGSRTSWSSGPRALIHDDEGVWKTLKNQIFEKGWYKLAIPAIMFVVQNNLQYVASENLSVAVFQITYQLKILTTALCSVIILHRTLYIHQWLSLFILTFGVAIVQIYSIPRTPSTNDDDNTSVQKPKFKFPTVGKDVSELQIQYKEGDMNQLVGLLAVVLACFSSGFASVYFEKKLKSGNSDPPLTLPRVQNDPNDSADGDRSGDAKDDELEDLIPSSTPQPPPSTPPSLWIRNIQLSTFGLFMGLLIVVFESSKDTFAQNFLWAANFMDPSTPASPLNSTFVPLDPVASFLTPLNPSHILENFTPLVYFVVLLQIMGGLLNALVMLYADNIAKGFATSCSILLSFAVEVGFWGREIRMGVLLGALLVGSATYLFGRREGGLWGR